MLGEAENMGHIPSGELSPSDELNAAFTQLIKALDTRINQAQWLSLLAQIDVPCALEDAKPTNRFSRLVGKFPEIYSFGDQAVSVPYILSNPVTIKAPIGQYGKEWAGQTAIAAATLIYSAIDIDSEVNVLQEVKGLNQSKRKLLDRYTHRKSGLSPIALDEVQARVSAIFSGDFHSQVKVDGAGITLAEGFQSVVFTSSALTMQEVSGYEGKPEKLLQDSVDQDLFSHISLIIPPQITAIMGKSCGSFKPPLVIPKTNGRLGINPIIIQHFNLERDGEYEDYATGATSKLDRPGCLLGRKLEDNDRAGVDMAARLFAQAVTLRA